MLRSLTIKPKWTALGIVKCSNCSAILASSELLNSMVKVGTFGENLLALWSTGKRCSQLVPWHVNYQTVRRTPRMTLGVVRGWLSCDPSQCSHWLHRRFAPLLKHSWAPNLHLVSFCLLQSPHWYLRQRHPFGPLRWHPWGSFRQFVHDGAAVDWVVLHSRPKLTWVSSESVSPVVQVHLCSDLAVETNSTALQEM